MKAMEHPMSGINVGEGASTAWIMLFGIGAGVIKFFNSYLLADTFWVAGLKAGMAAGFVAFCAAVGNWVFKLIKPYLENKLEKFKNKNKHQ